MPDARPIQERINQHKMGLKCAVLLMLAWTVVGLIPPNPWQGLLIDGVIVSVFGLGAIYNYRCIEKLSRNRFQKNYET
jgi:hypothetical protein